MQIEEFLNFGEENAVTAGELRQKTGMTKRQIFRCIRKLRRDGIPVCASSRGFWLSTQREEILRTAERQHRRALAELAIYSKMRASIPPHPDQLSLF